MGSWEGNSSQLDGRIVLVNCILITYGLQISPVSWMAPEGLDRDDFPVQGFLVEFDGFAAVSGEGEVGDQLFHRYSFSKIMNFFGVNSPYYDYNKNKCSVNNH